MLTGPVLFVVKDTDGKIVYAGRGFLSGKMVAAEGRHVRRGPGCAEAIDRIAFKDGSSRLLTTVSTGISGAPCVVRMGFQFKGRGLKDSVISSILRKNAGKKTLRSRA